MSGSSPTPPKLRQSAQRRLAHPRTQTTRRWADAVVKSLTSFFLDKGDSAMQSWFRTSFFLSFWLVAGFAIGSAFAQQPSGPSSGIPPWAGIPPSSERPQLDITVRQVGTEEIEEMERRLGTTPIIGLEPSKEHFIPGNEIRAIVFSAFLQTFKGQEAICSAIKSMFDQIPNKSPCSTIVTNSKKTVVFSVTTIDSVAGTYALALTGKSSELSLK